MKEEPSTNSFCTVGYIVRAVGERTEDLCIDLVRRYREKGGSLSVVREQTHADAVEKTLLTAADQGNRWVVVVDADMLLYPNALKNMKDELEAMHSGASVVHFAVSDKLYRMKRWGVTVFRRDAATEGLQLLQGLRSGRNLKIERALIKKLQEAGRVVTFSRTDVALHDFYQYYTDLYRKAYLNAIRNPAITSRARRCWKRMARVDPDYAVILKGSDDAANDPRQLSNSRADFDPSMLAAKIRSMGLEEKKPLTSQLYSEWNMEKLFGEQSSSLRKNKVARDFFDSSPLERVRRHAGRRLTFMKRFGTRRY